MSLHRRISSLTLALRASPQDKGFDPSLSCTSTLGDRAVPLLPAILPIPLYDQNGKRKGTQNLKVIGYHPQKKSWVMENKWDSGYVFADPTYMYLDAGVCLQLSRKQKIKQD
jgi:hypothetical protein